MPPSMRPAEDYGNVERQEPCFVVVASAGLLAQRPVTDDQMALPELVETQAVRGLGREMLAFADEERRSCLLLPAPAAR